MGRNPIKAKAGAKGGKKSGANFKRNKKGATAAGRRSAWARSSGKLEDFPLEYEDIPLIRSIHVGRRKPVEKVKEAQQAKPKRQTIRKLICAHCGKPIKHFESWFSMIGPRKKHVTILHKSCAPGGKDNDRRD